MQTRHGDAWQQVHDGCRLQQLSLHLYRWVVQQRLSQSSGRMQLLGGG